MTHNITSLKRHRKEVKKYFNGSIYEYVEPMNKGIKLLFLPDTCGPPLVRANLPIQQPATQQFVVLPLAALSQHNELLYCRQQITHRTPRHNQLLCRGVLCRNIVVLSYLTQNTTTNQKSYLIGI